ncbi:hypothetical protein AB2B38_009435 [Balneola sp. MJW-20]|uniref:hypothetical protein n=1 Tax=Gracilimonas aurantiaca TaxID=3234185 RepID=UPI003465DA76
MKQPLFGILLCAIVFGSISCSSNKDIFLAEEVKKNSTGAAFSIVALKNDWIYTNRGPNLAIDKQDLFYYSLKSSIAKTTPNTVYTYEDDLEVDNTTFSTVTVELNDKMFEINHAPDSLIDATESRYVYFLEDYAFRQVSRRENKSGYAGHEATEYNAMIFFTEFHLWDKQLQKTVSYGSVSKEIRIGATPNDGNYVALVEMAINEILKNSPFSVY